ncbi:AI-2E family transporter [Noviherbaspirillum sp.]|jgi:predicted PurR-regulated permease PerM|uniref:AI-2E family transporter n=1 Tax=Noviherbaspirillum sp. TaxID=1926288 RepID=UPI0025E2D21B|nr:AI-2E family transporter [Noviherbaspirillum sp.]
MDPQPGVLRATGRRIEAHEGGTSSPTTASTATADAARPDMQALAVQAQQEFSDSQFFRRTVLVGSLTIFTGLVLALIWFASDVFLVLFAGILTAVLLRAPTNWLTQHTPISERLALSLSIAALACVIVLLGYLFAVPIAEQIGQLVETLPRALVRMRQWVRHYDWAKPLQPLVTELAHTKLDVQLLGRASGLISSTVSAIVGGVVALFIGIYMAAQPRLYQRGFMHLLPRKARPRAYEVLDEIGVVLRWWLVGRMVTMLMVGVAGGIGLWWLDVPLAFTLGVLSGLLEFIPYIGPIMASIPPLLVAFNVDPDLAFYVLLLYVAIQAAENYLLTPLVEQRAVSLPPALVIFATLLLAALSGPLGVVLASPLTATCIVAVKLLYVEDVVEQPAPTAH